VDHVIPFAQGGFTCLCNLQPLCRRHHRLKTFGGWDARFTGPAETTYPVGTVEWTSPTGQTAHDLPLDLPGSNGFTPPPARIVPENNPDADIDRRPGPPGPHPDMPDTRYPENADRQVRIRLRQDAWNRVRTWLEHLHPPTPPKKTKEDLWSRPEEPPF
jgi:hypothetical protein